MGEGVGAGAMVVLCRAVEGEIGASINAFLCDNSQDQRTLYSLFDKMNIRTKPVIFTCGFTQNR